MRNHGRKVSGECLFDFGLSAPDTRGVCTTRETLTEMLCDERETGASKTSYKFCCQSESWMANVLTVFRRVSSKIACASAESYLYLSDPRMVRRCVKASTQILESDLHVRGRRLGLMKQVSGVGAVLCSR